ncbi:MAG: prokaryotic E2 ligase family D protein [Anaerolineae bacterium]|nr:prokaryotic E2 ligase family D protein [Anaerolineae bacterium]
MLATGLNGRALHTALSEQPSLSLNFYSFGITLRKQEGDRTTEYPVDPAQVAVALAARVTFDTGLLSGDTLLVRQEGISKTVVEYRRPQITGIFLDDAESALSVPLPGLVMIRKTGGQSAVSYAVYAVKRRPADMNIELFHAPLPNVFSSAAVCWGTVQRVSDEALSGASLAEDWDVLLGSSFGNHAVNGKSRSHKEDIRQKLIDLETRKARRYPTSDLISARKKLAQALEVGV